MLQFTKQPRLLFLCSAIVCGLLFSAAAHSKIVAQTSGTDSTPAKRSKDPGRDPFRKYEPPRAIVKKTGMVVPPSIEERISQYKAQKAAAMSARVAAPKPTTSLLLGEIQVVGITRTPRGYAAIVEATPIRLSYVIYPGERFYNGQLVAIEENRLVFRRETVFADGHREQAVEVKQLRPPSAVNTMTSAEESSLEAARNQEKKTEEKPASSEKP